MKKFVGVLFLIGCNVLRAQFAPAAGQPGTTAIHKDSTVFVNWAGSCTIIRGYQDISDTTLGYATTGDSSMALGSPGINGTVSLGDGGIAVVQFSAPVANGPGYDFAVFENSFSDDYLELAFVEVSSDGINFFRFAAVSNTQDTIQIAGFGLLNATQLNNLAGKYRANYGTPFDLQELSGISSLDINHITHVKIIDVVGSINSSYACFDSNGNKVNDPWPTPFPSSGFDLDAVGVIHQSDEIGISEMSQTDMNLMCTWNGSSIHVSGVSNSDDRGQICLFDISGRELYDQECVLNGDKKFEFDLSIYPETGIYLAGYRSQKALILKKIYIP